RGMWPDDAAAPRTLHLCGTEACGVNRRSFLRGALGAAGLLAAPAIVRASSLMARPRRPVTTQLILCGDITTYGYFVVPPPEPQQNEILDDMLFRELDLPAGRRTMIRTSLSPATWRMLYAQPNGMVT